MPLINNIPERYEDGFSELAKLSSEVFDKFKSTIVSVGSTYSLEKLGIQLQKEQDLENVDVNEILLSVGSIIPYIEKEETIDEIVNDIENRMAELFQVA